jgi:hypothetical protein
MVIIIESSRLYLLGQEADGEALIGFAGLINSVNQETFSIFLDSTGTPREYPYQYYEIRVDDGILYYKYTVDLLIDGVDWVPEYSIDLDVAKKIAEEFELEREKYNKDPLSYTFNMIRRGARLISYEDYKKEIDSGDHSRFEKDMMNSHNGVVRVSTNKEKAELLKKLHTLN